MKAYAQERSYQTLVLLATLSDSAVMTTSLSGQPALEVPLVRTTLKSFTSTALRIQCKIKALRHQISASESSDKSSCLLQR